MSKVLLTVPPFSTPFSPPLGISVLKSYLEKEGHLVKCFNFNTQIKLWNMHHNYFGIIDKVNRRHLNGYSLYWNILNQHLLAYINGASQKECYQLLKTLLEVYEIKQTVIDDLIQLVQSYFAILEKTVLEEVQINQYEYVGTSTYTTSLASSLFVHKIVKNNFPSVTTIMGGGVFTDDLAVGTENLQILLDCYGYVDKVIIGEGELLLAKFLAGEFPDKRMLYLKDIDEKVLDLNQSTTPDFSDFNIDSYFHLTIEGARSCPYSCKFCSEKMQWGPYRKKDAQYLTRQLIALKEKHEKNTFFMGDAIMNFYIEDLTTELIKEKAGILFDGYLRAEPQVMNRENAKKWAEAGLYRVRLGMESASPQMLKVMNKKITPENMSESLKSLASAGIRTTTYWVVGFPSETEADFNITLDFIRENHKHIYELEAHPYYYFPKGQGASADYDYECIYPQSVINLTKFKTYDIENPMPSREERYDRLQRVSNLCNELGIINIYSLADIYDAEDRWLSLHPLARTIYE